MVIDILRVDPRSAVGIGVVAPSDNACIGDFCWNEVAEPIYSVYCPSLLAMSVKSMDSHDTANTSVNTKHL